MLKKLKANSLDNKNVAIGYFDLIHKKHYELLSKYDDIVVLTFDHLPNKNDSINDINERVNYINSLGIKNVFVFDVMNNNMTAEAFVKKYLLKTKSVVVGSDFKFGCDVQSIYNFKDILKLDILEHDERFSTALVKQYLKNGNIDEANSLLEHPFEVSSKVVYGEKLGRTIGFRTINFNFDNSILLDGVYLTKTIYKNKEYKSITMIGNPKTIKQANKQLMETHILGFDKNIYGKKIRVKFYKYINGIIKFNSREELINAINYYKQLALDSSY